MSNYRAEYEKWLASDALSEAEKAELRAIAQDEKEIETRFFGPLEFGTAGLRGTMAVGLHNMNIHVIRWATQGFATVIAAEGEEARRRGVAICMDCRNHGMEFARAAAEVCCGNGIRVRIFESLRPTPELSFAVREYGCQAGINVTASHNPKEYNGYKVYWEDGAQLPPRHADAIARELQHIDIFTGIRRMDYDEAVRSGLITVMGEETDEKFLENVMGMVNDRAAVEKVADSFSLVYTPFHGCGHKLVPEALRRLGIKHLLCEPKQMVIDGDFPTVVSPNPENPEGFYLAIELAKQHNIDFILGTDPDADRVGIMVRDHAGEFRPVTGNQTGVLLLDYLIGARKRAGTLPENAVALKTIVTTEMARRVAESNGVRCFDTFTGFKFMAEKKNQLEESGEGKVIFSYEESYGYMVGDFVRDKDAVTASLLLTEMAAWYAGQGMTLFDALQSLYERYGWYGEKTHNLVMPGLDGLADMAKLMKSFREEPPAEIAGVKVAVRKDYSSGEAVDCATGAVSAMELSGSNVLRFELADGTTILIRPSGTEPKIKVYVLTQGRDEAERDANLQKYAQWVDSIRK
ncbi:MAG: phospho-sugar mutase [Oscillospiraceae bacterium]